MAELDSFKVIKALRDGGDYFWDSISSLETAIVNALSCNNVADKQQATKPKTRNLENSICNFIASIWGLNTKVEGGANIIAKWKRIDLNKKDPNQSNAEIESLVEKTRQKAINLYRKISGGSETQQEINLITLLHAHRLKLIKEVLSKDDKSKEDKLEEIKDILKNKGNFNPNFNLMDNIYSLTEVNFQPGDDLEWRSLLPEEPTPAKSPTNSSSIYPSQRRDPSQDRIILDKKTKEQLLFRLNDFGYSCLGVLESGAEKSHKIEALQELLREHLQPSKHFTKEHSDLKSDIRKKIESGASVVYLELYKINSQTLKATKSGDETEKKRATFYNSYKQQLLDQKRISIIKMATHELRQTKCEVNESIVEEQVETKKVESLLNSKAEIIAESGIKNGIDKMHYSLMGYPTLIDAIRTAMYNEAFIKISFAKGGELVETMRKMTGDDVTPKSSPNIQPRAQLTEPPMTAPRRPQKSKKIEPSIIAPTRSL